MSMYESKWSIEQHHSTCLTLSDFESHSHCLRIFQNAMSLATRIHRHPWSPTWHILQNWLEKLLNDTERRAISRRESFASYSFVASQLIISTQLRYVACIPPVDDMAAGHCDVWIFMSIHIQSTESRDSGPLRTSHNNNKVIYTAQICGALVRNRLVLLLIAITRSLLAEVISRPTV